MQRKFIVVFVIVAFAVIAAVFLNQQKSYTFSKKESAAEEPDVPILVLGLVGPGEGGKWHTAPDLTDTIILVDYRPSKKSMDLISIPRDIYGNFGGETFKINEAYQRNKLDALLEKLPDITGIKTDKYLVADLDLVKKIIDNLGGVDVNLTSPVVDSVSGYKMDAGQHHLNGEDAVWVIRNRFAKEGDFFRENNQHVIIKAVLDAYQGMNPITQAKFLFGLTSEISRIKTNVDLGTLLPLSRNTGKLEIRDIVLDFTTGLLMSSTTPVGASQAYILVPKLGIDKYDDIKRFIEKGLGN